jgi:hypothetical protein
VNSAGDVIGHLFTGALSTVGDDVQLNAADYPAGHYFVRCRVGDQTIAVKEVRILR